MVLKTLKPEYYRRVPLEKQGKKQRIIRKKLSNFFQNASFREKRELQNDFQLLGCLVEDLDAVVRDQAEIFDAHARLARQVDARLA